MEGSWRTYLRPLSWPFWAIHLAAVAGALAVGWSWAGLGLALASYALRMFFVTAGYHRYFSHRAFKTSRAGQLVLAFMAQTSAQKGALWWASHHRWHHKFSDQPEDVHSVKQRGFLWAHIGWLLADRWSETDMKRVADLARYPELRFLNRWSGLLPALVYALACLALGGLPGLVWGFFVSTVLLWHGTFAINSLAHVFGRRRYPTDDESRNSLALALLTLGEGWHNNHHHYQSSAHQGFRWWEIDITYYALRGLALLRLVWDLRRAPPEVVRPARGPAFETAPALVAPVSD